MRRRAPVAQVIAGLDPAMVELLLCGTVAADPFFEFTYTDLALAVIWRAHRGALLAEAGRRGITSPWGARYDGD